MSVPRSPRVERPIILLGAPRSGTTLLAGLIGAHPDVAVLHEPRLVWRNGNDRRSDELRPEHTTPKVVESIHRSFAAVLDEQQASRLVEKTPANAVRPRFVDAVFPDALYVHITRDGWGAVPSMRSFWQRRGGGMDRKQVRKLLRRLRESRPSQYPFYVSELAQRLVGRRGGRAPLYGPRLSGLKAVVDELGHLEGAALQWRTCVDQAATFGRLHPSGRYIELQLEALDADKLAAVLDFCGLSPSPAVIDRWRDVYDDEAARHQEPLRDEERAVVAPYVMPANAWLGYPERPRPAVTPSARGLVTR